MFPKLLLLVINKTSKPQPELYLDFQIFTSVFLLDQFSTILSPHCIQVVNLDSPRSWRLKYSKGFLLSWLLTLWLPSTLLLLTRLFQGTAAPTTSIKGSPWSAFNSTEPLTHGRAAAAQKGPWHQLMDNWVSTPYKRGIAFRCSTWPLSQGTVILPSQGMDLMINRLSSSLNNCSSNNDTLFFVRVSKHSLNSN